MLGRSMLYNLCLRGIIGPSAPSVKLLQVCLNYNKLCKSFFLCVVDDFDLNYNFIIVKSFSVTAANQILRFFVRWCGQSHQQPNVIRITKNKLSDFLLVSSSRWFLYFLSSFLNFKCNWFPKLKSTKKNLKSHYKRKKVITKWKKKQSVRKQDWKQKWN